ncbi:MAG: hypothetical protein H6677_19780 [Candidatus Obscuribacterales bacterium]|nr:hypothetical protein [Cyanobacteria bacterium HKST-UBA01]MCB9470523.1 hypothetical protein [Candidatus Obscuribacterales bacterium]
MTSQEKEDLLRRLAQLIGAGMVRHVRMHDDRSIEIKYGIALDRASTPFHSTITPDDPAWDVVDKLLGPLKPGDFKVPPGAAELPDLEMEKVLKPASIAFGIENGDVEKVERLEDGGISLWMIYDREKPSKELVFSANAPHIETILKYTGPLAPGQTYVFDRLR